MKECLKAMLVDKTHNLAAGLRTQNVVGQCPGIIPRTTLKTHWLKVKKLIVRNRDGEGCEDITAALASVESMSCKPFANCGVNLRHFDKTEEDALAAHLTIAFNCGFPLDQEALIAIAQALRDAQPGSPGVVSVGWIEGFLTRHPDIAQLKAAVIDWQRVGAANADNIKKYMINFNFFLARAKKEGAFIGDAQYWTADAIFNFDEVKSDGTRGRNKKAAMVFAGLLDEEARAPLLVLAKVPGQKLGSARKRGRAYISAPSDKGLPFHVTVGVTSCADGTYQAPFMVHSNGGNEVKLDDYLITEDIVGNLTGIPGVSVRRTKNGSMERWIFLSWAEHFVRNLRPGYGKGGKSVLLTLDGHTSRWCPFALRFLKENNVYVWCLPSHTSLWTQPNDLGPNGRAKALTNDCYMAWHRRDGGRGVMSRMDYNGIFSLAWIALLKVEGDELLAEPLKSNAASRSFGKAGLWPLQPEGPPLWIEATRTIGKVNTATPSPVVPAPSQATIEARVVAVFTTHFKRKQEIMEEDRLARLNKKKKSTGGIPSTKVGADCTAEHFVVVLEGKKADDAAKKENDDKKRKEKKEKAEDNKKVKQEAGAKAAVKKQEREAKKKSDEDKKKQKAEVRVEKAKVNKEVGAKKVAKKTRTTGGGGDSDVILVATLTTV